MKKYLIILYLLIPCVLLISCNSLGKDSDYESSTFNEDKISDKIIIEDNSYSKDTYDGEIEITIKNLTDKKDYGLANVEHIDIC